MARNLKSYKNTEAFQEKIGCERGNISATKTIPELMSVEGRARDMYYRRLM
jgi:CRISPR/Cas system-associated endonuclease Cas1